MSYDHDVVPTLGVSDGYDRIASSYHEYHRWLDSFDDAQWRRYLPRDLSTCDVVDIGAGDGRTYRRFQELGYGSYTAVDMCQKLLDRHPGANDVRRVQCDLSHGLALEDESADVITSFFIIEHIEDIQGLIEEIMRVLRQDGVWILTYFPQRRPYLHQIDGEQFKITQYYHRYEDIEQVISQTGAQLYTTDLLDEGVVIGKVFAIVK